jgi:DNA-binding response OmpR family regulator
LVFEQVAEVERLQPNLILLDVVFQERQAGWNFLQKLKRHEIPVVICTTAQFEVQEQETTLAQKGIPVLDKPFDLDALLHVVKQTLASTKRADISHEKRALLSSEHHFIHSVSSRLQIVAPSERPTVQRSLPTSFETLKPYCSMTQLEDDAERSARANVTG